MHNCPSLLSDEISGPVGVQSLDQPHPFEPLLRPSSVAFIGASNRPQTLGNIMVRSAAVDGYDGKLYPVNPKEAEIAGLPCYPDIASIPGPVDHAVIGLAD
jgi:acetate---CoA ligase (ADP-forming)